MPLDAPTPPLQKNKKKYDQPTAIQLLLLALVLPKLRNNMYGVIVPLSAEGSEWGLGWTLGRVHSLQEKFLKKERKRERERERVKRRNTQQHTHALLTEAFRNLTSSQLAVTGSQQPMKNDRL